jgi:hypothetical protein
LPWQGSPQLQDSCSLYDDFYDAERKDKLFFPQIPYIIIKKVPSDFALSFLLYTFVYDKRDFSIPTK